MRCKSWPDAQVWNAITKDHLKTIRTWLGNVNQQEGDLADIGKILVLKFIKQFIKSFKFRKIKLSATKFNWNRTNHSRNIVAKHRQTLKRMWWSVTIFSVLLIHFVECQVQKSTIDFSNAIQDPQTGQLCVMQQVCIADLEGLQR